VELVWRDVLDGVLRVGGLIGRLGRREVDSCMVGMVRRKGEIRNRAEEGVVVVWFRV